MNKVKIIVAFLLIIQFVVIHLIAPDFLPEIFELLKNGDIQETADYIASYGSMALIFSFMLTLFVNALGFPPAIIFSTANTLIFGIFWGIVVSVVAETVGVTISFLLLRFFFREQAEQIINKNKFLNRIDQYSGKKGFVIMLIARMIPYIPSALLNAVGALSSLSLRDYFLSSLIGKFPSTGIEAIIGHDAITQEEDPTRMIVVVIFAVVLIAWAWYYEKKIKSMSANESEAESSQRKK